MFAIWKHSHCSCPLCFCHLGFFTPSFWRCEGLFLHCQCNFLVRNPQIPARDQSNPSTRLAHVKQNHSLGNSGVHLCSAGGLRVRKKFLNCFHDFMKFTGNHDFIWKQLHRWHPGSLLWAGSISGFSLSYLMLSLHFVGWLPVHLLSHFLNNHDDVFSLLDQTFSKHDDKRELFHKQVLGDIKLENHWISFIFLLGIFHTLQLRSIEVCEIPLSVIKSMPFNLACLAPEEVYYPSLHVVLHPGEIQPCKWGLVCQCSLPKPSELKLEL